MQKLQREIRDAFKEASAITGFSVSSLPYLNAVIQEALRMFPPLPLGLPRIVPAGGVMIDGLFIPGGVSTNAIKQV